MTGMRKSQVSIELQQVLALGRAAAETERQGAYQAAALLWQQVADAHPDYRESDYAIVRRDYCNQAHHRGWH